MIAGAILSSDFLHIDDIVYNKILEKDILNISEIHDSSSPYDNVENGKLVIKPGDGMKTFACGISLKNGDVLNISFSTVNNADKNVHLTVDLYDENFDDPYDEFTVKIPKGEKSFSEEIAFYRENHPDKCYVRFFTEDSADLEINNISVDYLKATKNDSIQAQKAASCMRVLMIGALIYLAFFIIHAIRAKAFRNRHEVIGSEKIKNNTLYAAVALLVLMLLVVLYGQADISLPLIYIGGDEMGVYYFAKTIDQNGTSLVNPMVGGFSGGDLFDYLYSDKLSFLLIKIIGIFTDNPYLIVNLFYFLNFFIIAEMTVWVSRKTGISRINSLVVGLLFAFSPYIQMRYTHMWLTPYYMLPVACLLSINIIQGRIPCEEDKRRKDKLFWTGMMMSFFCAFTGLYYAYFACALFAAAMVIRLISIQGKNLNKEAYPLAYIASTIAGVIINIIPNLLYWKLNGANPNSELAIRSRGDAETYGLKLVQMIIPRSGHRVALFNKIAEGYHNNYPLVNENMTAAIGIVASIGLAVSLLLLFSNKNKYKEISWLSFAVFIIATIGGIGSIISVAIALPMRCYNRMSIIIMFLSLLIIGSMLDVLRQHIKPALAIAISLCIIAIGIFDQTVNYLPYDITNYENTKDLLKKGEAIMESGDMIFELPYLDWPSSGVEGSYGQFIGYIETDDLHWSYGAMQGREEADWQKYVANCEPAVMIENLKFAGYDGIYLERNLYSSKFGEEETAIEIEKIEKVVGVAPLVSDDGSKYFWKF